VTPAALATVLRQLTALQRLYLSDTSLSAAAARHVHDDTDGVVELVHAVLSLQQLSAVNVYMHVRLQGDWQDMAAAQQLNGKIWQWPYHMGARAEDVAVHVTHYRQDVCILQMATVRK
jgi:hypothetical protein